MTNSKETEVYNFTVEYKRGDTNVKYFMALNSQSLRPTSTAKR
jgi:hypothetical protein